MKNLSNAFVEIYKDEKTGLELRRVMPGHRNRAQRRQAFYGVKPYGHTLENIGTPPGTIMHATKGVRGAAGRVLDEETKKWLLSFWVRAFDDIDWPSSQVRWGWSRKLKAPPAPTV